MTNAPTRVKVYKFLENSKCNMCSADISEARVLGMRLNTSQGANPRSKIGIGVTVCRCAECGLNFPHPLPIPESITDHYKMPPEDYWKEPYFFIDNQYFQRQILVIKRLLHNRKNLVALDVGAGIGKAMHALQAAGFDCFGIEPNESFRISAIERMGILDDKIILTSIEEAQFSDEQFNFITFGAVLEHIYDPAAAIEKAMCWLKPGGLIHIEVPSSNHLMPFFLNTYFRIRGTNYVTNLSPMHSPFHLYEFSKESFTKHANCAGYEVIESSVDVGNIRHVPRFAKPVFKFFMQKTYTGQQLTVWLRKNT